MLVAEPRSTIPASLQRLDPFARRDAEVEAHDLRSLGEEHGEHLVVLDEAAIDLLQRRRRRRIEASELRSQELDPLRLSRGVGVRGCVAEDVHVERTARALAKGGNHPSARRRVRRADAERAERARVRHRGGHFGRGHARHGRLDDRACRFPAARGGWSATSSGSSVHHRAVREGVNRARRYAPQSCTSWGRTRTR